MRQHFLALLFGLSASLSVGATPAGLALAAADRPPPAADFPLLAEGLLGAGSWRIQHLSEGKVLLTLEDRSGRFHVAALPVPQDPDQPAQRDGDGWVLSPISVSSDGSGIYGLSYQGNPVAIIVIHRDGTITVHAL